MQKLKLLTLLLSLCAATTFGQQKWEGGVFAGASNYLGDLVVPQFTLKHSKPAFGIFIKNQMQPRFGLRMNLLYGQIEGADINWDRNVDRGAAFSSSLIELSLMGEYELFGDRRFDDKGGFKKTFSPYFFSGVGLAVVNPETNYDAMRPSEALDRDRNGTYSNTHFALPVGGGLRFDINRRTNLGLEFGLRLHFSDYMDGIKYAGNPDNNDFTWFAGASVGFRFGEKDTDKDGIVDERDFCPTQPGDLALNGCPDRDGDQIADRDDQCPDEPGELRLGGCPDSDGDGVADRLDDCPNEPGLRRFSGCPDSDGDNVVDKEDNCPNIPGLVALNGCPDADRDGIIDQVDKCPDEPGTAEHNGCPDSDDDGIADVDDNCPDLPGLKRFAGCPDTDRDGVDDSKDKCPTLAGSPDFDGCPEIKAEDKAVLDFAMKNVRFETNSARLTRSSLKVLDQIAEVMNRYPGYMLAIDGYTDDVGNDFANQQLSLERAKACYEYLASKGVDINLMTFAGHGETNPIADNRTAAGRVQNRRVEFTLKPKE